MRYSYHLTRLKKKTIWLFHIHIQYLFIITVLVAKMQKKQMKAQIMRYMANKKLFDTKIKVFKK
jgi:hypothetical protein